MSYPINEIVNQVKDIAITGNVIPHHWYQALTFAPDKKGRRRPNHVAVTLLADIVYWYRPVEVRCEHTGQFLRYDKKFKADFLQRSKEAFAVAFGFTKREVGDALKFLEDKGLIKRHYRTVLVGDVRASNILFIELIPEALREIQKCDSYDENDQNQAQKCDSYDAQTSDLSRSNVIGSALKRQTNTESTHKSTHKSSTKENIAQTPRKSPEPRPDFFFSLESGRFEVIQSNDVTDWEIAYPAIDIRQEVIKAEQWLKANPSKAKAKKAWRRFLIGWFSRANEKAENQAAYRSQATKNNRANPNLTEEERSQYAF